jgi:hypothetical protein
MATLDLKGNEAEISSFLERGDLEIRASEEKTEKLKDMIVGKEKITDQSIFLQHGGKIQNDCFWIPVHETFGKLLLRTAQDVVQNVEYELKKTGNFTEVTIKNKNPTLFKFRLPTSEI